MTRFHDCPLCANQNNRPIITSDGQRYALCDRCRLIYRDRLQLPQADEEVNRYRQHNNNIKNEGYVSFLNKAIQAALPYLSTGMHCLDYGCGPEPVLAQLLTRDHHIDCDYYDPFFFPQLCDLKYDFVFATETFEHFFDPGREIERLSDHMKPGAYLCIMTHLWHELERFDKWWYRRDHTHVSFYHTQTLRYISERWKMALRFDDGKRVFVLQKS